MLNDSSSIYKHIIGEIKNETSFENHGISNANVKDFLVMPYQKEFVNPIDATIEKYWVVLDESITEEKKGYLIFYSPKENAFGIGTKTNKKGMNDTGTFIGIYGSFIESIRAL